MSKIIVDQFQKTGGDVFTLPAAAAEGALVSTAGGVISTDATAVAPPSKTYDFTTNNAAALDVLWTDIKAGVVLDDIAFVRLMGSGISSDANCYIQFLGKDAGGVSITTGYLGVSYVGKYGSATSAINNIAHNLNNGYWQVPNYSTMHQTEGSTYGSGLNFDAIWHIRTEGTYGNYGVLATCSYQQSTIYTSPNVENIGWNNQGTSAPPATAAGGFRMLPTAGTLDRGYLTVTLVMK